MAKPKKVFLAWNEDEDYEEGGYYTVYSSLEDLVDTDGDGTEVYEATPKRLGVATRIVKIKVS